MGPFLFPVLRILYHVLSLSLTRRKVVSQHWSVVDRNKTEHYVVTWRREFGAELGAA